MGRSYRKAMEHIEVTSEMRKRILENLAKAEKKPVRKTVRFVPWKQVLSFAACAAVLLVGLKALPRGGELGGTPPAGSGVAVGNPIQEYSSLEALSAAAGFEVKQPGNLPFEVQETTYSLISGELAQVEQTGPAGESVLYRISQEEGDNSGDYNIYSREETQTIDGVSIALKGGEDGWHLAIWQRADFSYSLNSSMNLTEEQMQAMLETVL